MHHLDDRRTRALAVLVIVVLALAGWWTFGRSDVPRSAIAAETQLHLTLPRTPERTSGTPLSSDTQLEQQLAGHAAVVQAAVAKWPPPHPRLQRYRDLRVQEELRGIEYQQALLASARADAPVNGVYQKQVTAYEAMIASLDEMLELGVVSQAAHASGRARLEAQVAKGKQKLAGQSSQQISITPGGCPAGMTYHEPTAESGGCI